MIVFVVVFVFFATKRSNEIFFSFFYFFFSYLKFEIFKKQMKKLQNKIIKFETKRKKKRKLCILHLKTLMIVLQKIVCSLNEKTNIINNVEYVLFIRKLYINEFDVIDENKKKQKKIFEITYRTIEFVTFFFIFN